VQRSEKCLVIEVDQKCPVYRKNVRRPSQSDAEILAYARQTVITDFHQSGTCKMGPDAMAVVDDRLRVHGMTGLRVIDASIMPNVVCGNTNAPTMMIGEKGAAMV
jgi:choline dehydrogenase